MTDRGIHFAPPDHVVFVALIAESVLLGHEDPNDGIAWAVREGYLALDPSRDDDHNLTLLDAGREHVAARTTRG